jgi:Na+/proline symporter
VSWLLAAILGYLALQVAIGVWVARRIHSESDFLVAGRSLGYPLLVFSVFATWFGAESVMASSARVHREGFALTEAEPVAYGVCLVLAGLVFAAPLWRRGLTTFADFFRERYSRGVELAAALIMIPSSLFWAGAQLRGFAHVLGTVTPFDATLLLVAAAVFCVVYTTFGGLLADVITDMVQGVVIVIGLAALALAVVLRRGGVGATIATIAPERVNVLEHAGGLTTLGVLEEWAIPVVGSVVAVELVSRMIAARTATVARTGTAIAGLAYIAVGLLPVFIGLGSLGLAPGLDETEEFLPALARSLLPDAVFVLFAGAIVSAILSTVNTILLTSSGLVSHNLVAPALGIDDDKAKLWLARAGVAVFGAVALVLALTGAGIGALVEQASAFGSAGVVVVTAFGLFSGWGGPRTALVTLLGGLVIYLWGAWAGWPYPFLASLAAALLLYGGGAAAGRRAPVRRS